MLTQLQLEQLLLNSPIAQEFFRDAQLGLFCNDQYHDLFLNTDKNLIERLTSDLYPLHSKNHRIIMRMHEENAEQNFWRNLTFKTFLILCVQQYVHEEVRERRMLQHLSFKHASDLEPERNEDLPKGASIER
jgi:hypothetical protein